MKFPCEWNTSILLAKHVIFVVLVFVTFPTPLETTQCKVCLFTLYWKIILEDRNLSQLFIITGFLLALNIHWIILSLSLFFICAFFFHSYQKLSTHKHYTTQPHNTNSGEIWWHRNERKKKNNNNNPTRTKKLWKFNQNTFTWMETQQNKTKNIIIIAIHTNIINNNNQQKKYTPHTTHTLATTITNPRPARQGVAAAFQKVGVMLHNKQNNKKQTKRPSKLTTKTAKISHLAYPLSFVVQIEHNSKFVIWDLNKIIQLKKIVQ